MFTRNVYNISLGMTPPFVLLNELQTFLERVASGTHGLHGHFVPDFENYRLEMVQSADLVFVQLRHHIGPNKKVERIQVRGAGRPQSFVQKVG